MFHNIRWRIAFPFVLLALATMLAMTAYLSTTSQRTYLNDLERQLTDDAFLIADIIEPFLGADGISDAGAVFVQRYAALLDVRISLIADDGTLLADSMVRTTGADDHLDRPEVQQALATGRGVAIRTSASTGERMMYSAVRLAPTADVSGYVRLAVPMRVIDERIASLNRTLLAGTLGALMLIVALAFFIAERTTRPVRQLTNTVEQMTSGNMSVRTLPASSDEIGRLAEAFNAMAERVQSEVTAVTDQRNKLEMVLTHMTDGAVITDAEGRVQLMNPAAERLLGLTGKSTGATSLVSVVRDHRIAAVWQRCRQTGKEQSDVVEGSGDRGQFLRVIATPMRDRAGGGELLILQDLTQVRRLETIRRDFISNISHELRNPLAALTILVETMQDGALDDRPAAERFLTGMQAEVDAMNQMVRELLELSRIESGKVPLRLARTPVADMVRAAVDRLRPLAGRAGLDVAVDLPADLPDIVADGERLQQVLSNILHNAVKFTPPGGRISVSATGGASVTISVQDTGVGISATDLPRIFERFYKADRARSGGGTGLGLAIAKHIVQAHGGDIWASSVEGRGATFSFTIPAARDR